MGWNDQVIEQFLQGQERIADMFDRDSLVLVETTGAKSGQKRTTPLVHFPDGDRLLIVASAAGADKHPAWFHNVVANPEVDIQRWEDGELAQHHATATVLAEEERAEKFAQIVAQAPGFGEYQTKTERVIPVVALSIVD